MGRSGMHKRHSPRGISPWIGWKYLQRYTERVVKGLKWSQFEPELMSVEPKDTDSAPVLRMIAENDIIVDISTFEMEKLRNSHHEIHVTKWGCHCGAFGLASPGRHDNVAIVKDFLDRHAIRRSPDDSPSTSPSSVDKQTSDNSTEFSNIDDVDLPATSNAQPTAKSPLTKIPGVSSMTRLARRAW